MRLKEFEELLSYVPVDSAAKSRLGTKMRESGRHYHGVDHLAVLWERHRAHASEAGLLEPKANELIACAIAYHDSIYDGARGDNEELSALYWMDESEGTTINDEDRDWVAATIRATHDHLAYTAAVDIGTTDGDTPDPAVMRERARLWMLDLDLTPLAERPEDFDRNTRMLRDEVPHLPEEQWRAGTRRFLKNIYDAPLIYRSPILAAKYEAQARLNLRRELGL